MSEYENGDSASERRRMDEAVNKVWPLAGSSQICSIDAASATMVELALREIFSEF